LVNEHHAPAGERRLRRRPPCRDFGGDARTQELARRIVDRAGRISALHREQLADIAEFDRAEGWRGDGAVSMVTWVTGQCGVSTSTARQWVRSASNLESLPCLAEGLASGAMSLDLVEPLAEVATPSSDAALREASVHWSVRQARELVAWHRAQREEGAGAEADSAEESGVVAPAGDRESGSAAREFARRTLRFNDTRHSMWVAFTRDEYAVAKSVLVGHVAAEQRGRAAEGPGGPVSNTDAVGYTPYDQRLYDALLELFHAGSGPPAGSGSGSGSAPRAGNGGPAGRAGRAGRAGTQTVRPRVVVHAPLELLIGCSADSVAEIAGVGPVPLDVVRRLACDADVDLAVEERGGSILDQGRARRDPTAVQRVEIDRRDKGCRFPGCTFREFTDVHHVRHWVDGGLTNMENLVTLCGRHHRAVHELGWAVTGDADAVLTFTGPHGRSMRSAPSPTWRPWSVVRSVPTGRSGPMRR
jgi:HNH endonuclease